MDPTADTSIHGRFSARTMSQDGAHKDPIARTDSKSPTIFPLFVAIRPDFNVFKKICTEHFIRSYYFSPKYELPPPNWDDGIGARPMQQDRDRDEVRLLLSDMYVVIPTGFFFLPPVTNYRSICAPSRDI
jgi:hypothetical protein